MAKNELDFLTDINYPKVEVLDPNRQKQMAWRKQKKRPEFGWKLRPIILCTLALVSAVAAWYLNRPPTDEGLPNMAHGTWHTLEDKYAGQGFTLSPNSLTFHLGADYSDVQQRINRVDRRMQDGFEHYDLYVNLTDQWPVFSLVRAGDNLVLPSQREIKWRKGAIPDAEGVVPTEFFVAGYVPERNDSTVATTTDKLLELCMQEVTRVRRDRPVSCIDWLGMRADSIKADSLAADSAAADLPLAQIDPTRNH